MSSRSAPGERIVMRVVDVYPYRLGAASTPEFLLLKRAAGKTYGGAWRMIGGKIAKGEAAWQTGLRELREETGMRPIRYWALPSLNRFYEWQSDRVNIIPAFAAEVSGSPTLDDEHIDHGWFAPEEAAERLEWPEQQRLLRLAARMLDRDIPQELIIPETRWP